MTSLRAVSRYRSPAAAQSPIALTSPGLVGRGVIADRTHEDHASLETVAHPPFPMARIGMNLDKRSGYDPASFLLYACEGIE